MMARGTFWICTESKQTDGYKLSTYFVNPEKHICIYSLCVHCLYAGWCCLRYNVSVSHFVQAWLDCRIDQSEVHFKEHCMMTCLEIWVFWGLTGTQTQSCHNHHMLTCQSWPLLTSLLRRWQSKGPRSHFLCVYCVRACVQHETESMFGGRVRSWDHPLSSFITDQ